ncbi:unnamed protein product, partial [Adineta steineri]
KQLLYAGFNQFVLMDLFFITLNCVFSSVLDCIFVFYILRKQLRSTTVANNFGMLDLINSS